MLQNLQHCGFLADFNFPIEVNGGKSTINLKQIIISCHAVKIRTAGQFVWIFNAACG